MKLTKLAMIAAIACGVYSADASIGNANDIQLAGCFDSSCDTGCDCGEPACGCETIDLGCCDGSGCDGGCDSACGCGAGGCLGGVCGLLPGGDCLGDPWKLFDGLPNGWDIGGWAQTGYHSRALPIFNDRPDEFNLHQAWLYAEKAIDTEDGFDLGGRIDYLYGIDAQNTQAFGIDNDHWDNDFDNGGPNGYGHAIPQLYLEAGYGDLSVKVGHFYTIIGWEVVGAPGNFFYSHAYTFNYSEPFTHTGVLANYQVNDNVNVWGGYTLGWDSGFEDNGDSYLGGISAGVTDDLTLIYAAVAGRFDDGDPGVENGYMHSIVADYAVTDSLQYIFQTDYLDTDDNNGATVRDTIGINQYLIKTLNDSWAVGARFEWYNNEGIFDGAPAGNDADIYALTGGINYRPTANFIVRPEVRWDWDDDQVAGLADGDDQFTFGVDSILTF